jgi:hypothetical protein
MKKTALNPMNSTLFFDPKNDRNEISEKSAPKFGRKNRVFPEDYAPRIFDSFGKSTKTSPQAEDENARNAKNAVKTGLFRLPFFGRLEKRKISICRFARSSSLWCAFPR